MTESHATQAKATLDTFLTHGGYGRVEREAPVWPGRRYRADFFLPDQSPPCVIEYDGLMVRYGKGGQAAHSGIDNILSDSEKGNLAQALGYRFYRFNAKTVHNGSAFTFLTANLTTVTGGENQ